MDDAHDMAAIVLPGVVFLAATSLLVPTFRKLGMSAVMAFLAIGVLIGPHILGLLPDHIDWTRILVLDPDGPARWLAELGVVFLLFAIGLEVSTSRLWALRRWVLGFGLAQVAVTAVAITLIAIAFGNATAVAVVLGLAFALSSTAVVLQLLGERRQIAGATGKAAFSVLLLQDLAVIPILFVVDALGSGATVQESGFEGLATAVTTALASVTAILFAGRYLLRPLFRWVASIGSREVFVAAILLVAVAAALTAELAGLSMALGAFLAGLLLAETEYRHEIEADIEPCKGLLLGLFFVTVGMQVDLGQVLAMPLQIIAGVLGLIVVKVAILVPLGRAFGLSWPHSVEVAFLLAQAGEFAFVIVAAATRAEAIPADIADFMLIVVALSLFMTPVVASLGGSLARRLTPEASMAPPDDAEIADHVILAGYGRVGQTLGELLQQEHVAHIAVDSDVKLVDALRKRSWPVHFGDASRKDVLAALGAAKAAAIVVTMNENMAVERVVKAIRAAWPHVPVFARAHDPAQARRLHAAGATFAHPETIEATLQLGDALLQSLGIPDEAVRRLIEERRQREIARARVAPLPEDIGAG
jgi:monovalent cation:proton antiporter-2 (CPA2) family protein